MQFTCNYTKADYTNLKALETVTDHKFSVWFGASASGNSEVPYGQDGKFDFNGQLSVYVTGGGVNEVVGMTVSIAPSSKITVGT